jgi:hypothetical protein
MIILSLIKLEQITKNENFVPSVYVTVVLISAFALLLYCDFVYLRNQPPLTKEYESRRCRPADLRKLIFCILRHRIILSSYICL